MPCSDTAVFIGELRGESINVENLTVTGTLMHTGPALVASGVTSQIVTTSGAGTVGAADLTAITSNIGAYTVAVAQTSGAGAKSVATFSIARADAGAPSPAGEMVHRICALAGTGGLLDIVWPAGSPPALTQTGGAATTYEVVLTGAPF